MSTTFELFQETRGHVILCYTFALFCICVWQKAFLIGNVPVTRSTGSQGFGVKMI